MKAAHQAQVTFYLTGRGNGLDAVAGLGLRPALLAGYRDLASLRYDFPLVLLPGDGVAALRGLSELFDAACEALAGEKDAERLRHHAARMEREIRRLAAAQGGGGFAALWQAAAANLAPHAEAGFADSLTRLAAKLPALAEVADCDAALPGRVLGHAWEAAQRGKAARFRADLTRLILKLSDILRADFVRSEEGHSPENLRASIGAPHAEAFDFAAMSRVLASASTQSLLTYSRRERIRWLLAVLQAQRFHVQPQKAGGPTQALPGYGFVFETASQALEAWQERLPRLVELVKAMNIAELEVSGDYREARHDALFANFTADRVSAAELAAFPDYLVRLNADTLGEAEQRRVLEAIAAGLPFKIVLQTDDLLAPLPATAARAAFGLTGRTLTSAAISLGEAFVLQSAASNLLRLRARLFAGLAAPGPALFSVFSGAGGHAGELPAYLVAAASMESRVFPAFVYDPAAGADWASRFSLEGNPQPEQDWPSHSLSHEDAGHHLASETVAFTAVDFLACDDRYAAHFARVPRAAWNEQMVAADTAIARTAAADTVPCLTMVDAGDHLQKVMADDGVIREARRVGAMWAGLRELGGIRNSHAARLLAHEQAAWQEQLAARAQPAEPVAAAPVAESVVVEEAPAAEPVRSPEIAYIETARCSSCNECTQINDKMFAYNKDKQAYIANPDAGSFRQLVEAAESCQVSVIHPGLPRNPKEAGLEELLVRAALFQ